MFWKRKEWDKTTNLQSLDKPCEEGSNHRAKIVVTMEELLRFTTQVVKSPLHKSGILGSMQNIIYRRKGRLNFTLKYHMCSRTCCRNVFFFYTGLGKLARVTEMFLVLD